ncbi:MAG: EmrB/QacA family drug resistance transporter, partial [Terriglobia bacterium]
GFLFVPINVMAFYFIPREKTNNATGLINVARNIGGSVGISVVATLQARRAQMHQDVLVSHLTPYDHTYQSMLSGTAHMLQSAGASASEALAQAQGLLYGELLRQSAMLAFIDVFKMLAYVCLGMIPLMFLMKKMRPRKGSVPVH